MNYKEWETVVKVYEAVGAYINAHQLDQISVTRVAGIPDGVFAAMLSGKKKMYADDLVAICQALGVSASVFIDQKTA